MMQKGIMKESEIEDQILKHLDTLGGVVWKIAPAGFVFKDKTSFKMRMHKSPFARRKTLDIFFLYQGIFYALEVKTEKEFNYIHKHWNKLKADYPLKTKGNRKHYAEQILTVEKINKSGGVSMFVCSVEQVKNLMSNMKYLRSSFGNKTGR